MGIRHTHAVSFAGIGINPLKSKGLLFGLGPAPESLDAEWEWRNALSEPPSRSDSRVDLLTGELRPASVDITLTLDAELLALFAYQESRPSGGVVDALTASTDDAELTETDRSFQVVRVGREAIYLGAISGGSYPLTRGHWGSRAQAHAAGTYLYDRPAYWRQREMRTWEVRDDGELVQTGLFYLDWRPTAQGGLNATLTAQAQLQALKNLRLVPPDPLVWDGRYRERDGEIVLSGSPRSWTTSAWKKPGAAGNTTGVFLVDGALVHRFGNQSLHLSCLLGSSFDQDAGTQPGLAREIALWCPRVEARVLRTWQEAGDPSTAPGFIAPTTNCPYPHHPATIAAALYFSTNGLTEIASSFDVMAPGRSLGMRQVITGAALTEWRAIIDATPHLVVDQFMVGLDDAPEVIEQRVRDMLFYYGLAVVEDSTGVARLRQIAPANVVDHATATMVQPLNDLFDQATPQSSVLDGMTAEVGALRWRQGRTVSTQNNSIAAGQDSLAQRQSQELTETISLPFVSRDNAEGVARLSLVSMLVTRYQGIPEVMLRAEGCHAMGWDYTLLDRVRLLDFRGLETPIIVDPNGEVTASFEGDAMIAQITGVRVLDREAGALELRLALSNYALRQLIRLRGPSFVVSNVVSLTQVECTPVSAFGLPLPDIDYLEPGDQLEVWSKAGAPRDSGVQAVSGKSGLVLTLADRFTFAPLVGDVLRLARADDYDNDALVSGVSRPYVYLASDGTIPGYGQGDVYG